MVIYRKFMEIVLRKALHCFILAKTENTRFRLWIKSGGGVPIHELL